MSIPPQKTKLTCVICSFLLLYFYFKIYFWLEWISISRGGAHDHQFLGGLLVGELDRVQPPFRLAGRISRGIEGHESRTLGPSDWNLKMGLKAIAKVCSCIAQIDAANENRFAQDGGGSLAGQKFFDGQLKVGWFFYGRFNFPAEDTGRTQSEKSSNHCYLAKSSIRHHLCVFLFEKQNVRNPSSYLGKSNCLSTFQSRTWMQLVSGSSHSHWGIYLFNRRKNY